MFKIYDGREHFYQWDLDRKLIVEDPSIKEVHFCNRTDDCSLVCETYVEDGITLANVPNILLQTDWKIHVYAYDGSYTKHDECYEVKSRTKPADYEYTETEILNWSRIEERIDVALEDANTATEAAAIAASNATRVTDAAITATTGANEAASRANEAATLAQLTINNMPNNFANALKGNLSGEVVSAKDVSPAEHTLEVKASSKNLFKTTNYSLGSISPTDGSLTGAGQTKAMVTDFIYLLSGNYVLSNIVGANLRYVTFYNLNKEFVSNSWTGRAKTFKFTVKEDCYIRIDIEIDGNIDIENYDTFMDEYQFMLEVGDKVTTYTPYLTAEDIDATTLSAYGKNLFNNDISLIKPVTYNGKTKTYTSNGREIRLSAGIYTLSAHVPSDYNQYIYVILNDKNGKFVANCMADRYSPNYTKSDNYFIAGTPDTYTINIKVSEEVTLYIYDAISSHTLDYSKNAFSKANIQLEVGEKETEYEPYKAPINYDIYLSGEVPNVASIYPNMTLITDTPGVLLECEYNRDITKAFAELEQAIISLGGNV